MVGKAGRYMSIDMGAKALSSASVAIISGVSAGRPSAG